MKISPEEAMARLSRLHLAEIGVALTLTVATLLFAAWTVWAAEASGVAVADAWARPAFGHGRATAAYMTIVNKGEEDEVLVAAQSPEAKSVELHQTTMKADGVMQMREARGGFPIAADTTLKLAPGGMHLMIMGLDKALADGGQLKLTLEFANTGPIEIVVPVRANAPEGSGADQSHH
jgi:copper(I)-binding protein